MISVLLRAFSHQPGAPSLRPRTYLFLSGTRPRVLSPFGYTRVGKPIRDSRQRDPHVRKGASFLGRRDCSHSDHRSLQGKAELLRCD